MIDLKIILDNSIQLFHSPIGWGLFILIYALWVIFLLPGVWASMTAGFLFGTWLGSFLVFLGASIGAISSFLLGRTILRKWVQKRLLNFPKLQALDKAVSREGLKLVLLTRLSPAFPFSLLNFAYGISDVSMRDYCLGLIGIIPGTILFCGFGALAGDIALFSAVLSAKADLKIWLVRVVGIIATIGVVWLVGRAARSVFQESDFSI